jgi:prepilin-type N-terminal cleavage/methylation domain-containing protein
MDLEAVSRHLNRQGIQHGFTLLEILIVIGILTILLSVGFPQYASYQRGIVMRDVSNQIAQLLRDSSTRAKAETTKFKLAFSLNRPEGDDITVSWTSNGLPKSNLVRLERDASITGIDDGLSFIEFDARGRPNTTKPVVIHAAFADRSATVRLLTTGKTVIQ